MTDPEIHARSREDSVVPVSVIIAAYNEEHVIARCLGALMERADPGELEIVVVCNGCSDATADVVAVACPEAKVVELTVASKIAALNAGDEAATRFPRFYVDADVEVSSSALRAAARVLASGRVQCIGFAPCFEVEGRPWVVRKFYEVWEQLPYLRDDVVGNGAYGLSAKGRARFGAFPDIIADDQFVLQQFDRSDRHTLRDQRSVVHTPRHLVDLVRIRARAYRGTRELARLELGVYQPVGGVARALLKLARRPANVPGEVAYVAVVLTARVRAFFLRPAWERDESSRTSRV